MSSTCTFYDITAGDTSVDCDGTHDYFTDGVTVGVLSTSDSAYAPAYASGIGWDFTTGIGTVNVNNLITNFASTAAAAPQP